MHAGLQWNGLTLPQPKGCSMEPPMSQLGGTSIGQNKPASSNIYTVMALIAVIALVTGIGYVWYRSSQLFDTSPFEFVSTTQTR